MLEAPDEVVPLRHPTFALRDGSLYFLVSHRPARRPGPAETSVWGRIDGRRSAREVTDGIEGGEEALGRLHEAGIVELAPLRVPEGRRRVLVVEPHMDDAVLSVGGTMWAQRDACAFTVATLASRSNYTSYYLSEREFFEVEGVSELRRLESQLALRTLGGCHRPLGCDEAPLRCHDGDWTRSWYRAHAKVVDGFIAHAAPEREVDAWAEVIEGTIDAVGPDELWLPLGVGSHVDHELARDAALRVLQRRDPGVPVFLYQDVPYASELPGHTEQIVSALEAAGAVLEPRRENVSASLAAKLRLVGVFGSQFKPAYMAPRVEEAARRASPDGAGLFELRYALLRRPGRIDRGALYSGRARVEDLAGRLSGWYARHRDARRVRLLCGAPMPRWRDDTAELARLLPAAALEVHVRDDHRGGGDGHPDRVRLHPVRGGRAAWLARLARVTLERPSPTLVVTGSGLERWAPLARATLPLADVATAATANDLVLALGVLADGSV